MKRAFCCLLLLLFVVVDAQPVFAQESHPSRISPRFSTAKEAFDFANNLPDDYRATAQFVCEYTEGAPASTTYRVYAQRTVSVPLTWSVQEGFPTLKEAVDFVNREQAVSRFVACNDPRGFRPGNLQRSSVTVFYIPDWHDDENYEIIGGEFPTPEAAADYVNAHLDGWAARLARFIPEFSSVSPNVHLWQSTWRIVSIREEHDTHDFWKWKVAHYGNLGFALMNNQGTGSALEEIYTAAFTVRSVTSNVVVFSLQGENKTDAAAKPEAEFIVPAKVCASKTLLAAWGKVRLFAVVGDAVHSLYDRTKIRIVFNGNACTIPDPPSYGTLQVVEGPVDPEKLGNSISREPNTLNIILTDAPLALSRVGGEADEAIIHGWFGKGWVVVSCDPQVKQNVRHENTLLHELSHVFGAPHVENSGSVMCASPVPSYCSRDTLRLDEQSLASIDGGIKAIKRMGLDTYVGLRAN